MFAIRLGNTEKFLNKTYCDVVVSIKPKTYSTKEEAQTVLAEITKTLQTNLQNMIEYNAKQDSTYVKAVATLDKDTKELEKLFELPYKDVYKRVAILEKRVKENQQLIIDRSVYLISNREINRIQNILSAKLAIVKIQRTVAVVAA